MKILILIVLLSFQPPKWKYIVFFNTNVDHQGWHRYDDKGKPVEPRQDRPLRLYYSTSRGAHNAFDSLIDERNQHKTYHGMQITKVWIDSIQVK